MKTLFLGIVALMSSWAVAQDESKFDNSKLLPLVGDWTGNAAMHEEDKSASTIKGAKILGDRWIRLDMQFETKQMGKIEAQALLTSDEDGVVTGYFFASFAPEPVFGKGKFEGKKLTINATTTGSDEILEFIFDLSAQDAMKFTATEMGDEKVTVMQGEYKKKK
jgi:hypothetical protein